MNTKHAEGKSKGSILLLTLSTCIWCRRTKQLLADLGIAYDYVDIDLAEGLDKDEAVAILERWNPDRSFPTMIINDEHCIIGYQADQITEVLGA